mmetsp:Transcript_28253/g.81716  ORF Transcript_28253/g.81716 Transcript_28253/m.81716 type:complete len:187 (-) Transcript_28253:46-606(-)
MSLSIIVRSACAVPARWASAAAATHHRYIRPGLRQQTNASTRVFFSGRRCFASANGAVNGVSGDDEGQSSDPAASSLAASMQWRRKQIDTLESKFTPAAGEGDDINGTEGDEKNGSDDDTPDIISDKELQPMWRDMESRVTRRRSLTAAERGPEKVGRRNIRKSDEDVWLASGLYNESNNDDEKEE